LPLEESRVDRKLAQWMHDSKVCWTHNVCGIFTAPLHNYQTGCTLALSTPFVEIPQTGVRPSHPPHPSSPFHCTAVAESRARTNPAVTRTRCRHRRRKPFWISSLVRSSISPPRHTTAPSRCVPRSVGHDLEAHSLRHDEFSLYQTRSHGFVFTLH